MLSSVDYIQNSKVDKKVLEVSTNQQSNRMQIRKGNYNCLSSYDLFKTYSEPDGRSNMWHHL